MLLKLAVHALVLYLNRLSIAVFQELINAYPPNYFMAGTAV